MHQVAPYEAFGCLPFDLWRHIFANYLDLPSLQVVSLLNSHFVEPARVQYLRKIKKRADLLQLIASDARPCSLWLQAVTAINFRKNGEVFLMQSDELFHSSNGDLKIISIIHCEQASRLAHDIALFPWKNLLVFPCAKSHRIYIIGLDGNLLKSFGQRGSADGDLHLPMSCVITRSEEQLIVSDTWNHRVQIFTTEGKFVRSFGSQGAAAGQLHSPHAITLDREENIIVCDTCKRKIELQLSVLKRRNAV